MIFQKLKKYWNLILIKLHQKTYKGRLHYLFERNKSDVLFVVFPAFTGHKRRYNYIRGLKTFKVDKLFLLDDFGVEGSYLLFENGKDLPLSLTKGLLLKITRKNYNKIYTIGSSKGGTCAIYFGLEIGVDYILTGACQYNLGSYLHREDHEEIFKGMMGCEASQKEADFLNNIMPEQIESKRNDKTFIYNIYSEKELTYQRQIIDLNKKLEECKIHHKNIVLDFDNHEDVGKHFLAYIQNLIPQLLNQ